MMKRPRPTDADCVRSAGMAMTRVTVPDRASMNDPTGRSTGPEVPSGVIAIAEGSLPTLIGLPTVPVDSVIGVTVPSVQLATKAVVPSGVIATAEGSLIASVALVEFVAVLIGVRVPDSQLCTGVKGAPGTRTPRRDGQRDASWAAAETRIWRR
jgi:hypothetical protein